MGGMFARAARTGKRRRDAGPALGVAGSAETRESPAIGGAFLESSERIAYQSSRTTTRVLIGSFIAARRSASRAVASLTPSSSNMIRPGLIRAAQ